MEMEELDQYHLILSKLYSTHGRHYEKDHVVFNEGDEGNEIFIIVSGSVKVIIHDYVEEGGKRILDGAASQTVAILSEGQVFGELALLDSMPRSATLIAQEGTHVIVMNKDEFYQQILEFPSLAVMFLKLMTKHMRRMDSQLRSALGYDRLEWWVTL